MANRYDFCASGKFFDTTDSVEVSRHSKTHKQFGAKLSAKQSNRKFQLKNILLFIVHLMCGGLNSLYMCTLSIYLCLH